MKINPRLQLGQSRGDSFGQILWSYVNYDPSKNLQQGDKHLMGIGYYCFTGFVK